MKALVKVGKGQIKVQDRQRPILEENEILIKVSHCGVCGSDLHAAHHAKGYEFVPKEIILGHELSGTVIEVHPASSNEHLLNAHVVVEPGVTCSQCEQCRQGKQNICSNIQCLGLHFDGGMAEYVKVNAASVHLIPENLPFKIAALAEPLSVALHAVEKVSNDITGKKVLVQGCGIIGFFVAIAAKNAGAFVTVLGLRRDRSVRLSAIEKFDIAVEIVEDPLEKRNDADIVFECSGSSLAAQQGISRLKKGGSFVVVALYEQDVTLPLNVMVRGEINLLPSYGYYSNDFEKAFNLLASYKEQFAAIVAVYPLLNGALAFEDARKQRVLKSMIEM
ncbi:alcohol dehydrogenase catalytic domain-containing protein [Lysinibacillus sp. M3]|uniref:Alcohol dehydrogenase catalytic domain-containing protein n=1 Tax=Lysinibacillus zambalensis TaxID=3160866 RepID=A0ABV1MNH3_9BACI